MRIDLPGASQIKAEFHSPERPNLPSELAVVEDSWKESKRLCGRSGWGHVMRGVSVTLLDRAEYTARCWDDDRIYINVPRLAVQKRPVSIIVHEFGHRVWFQCLSREEQETWKGSWQGAKRQGRLPTAYAKEDDLEDFAEVFSALICGGIDKSNLERWESMRTRCPTFTPKHTAPFHASYRRPRWRAR